MLLVLRMIVLLRLVLEQPLVVVMDIVQGADGHDGSVHHRHIRHGIEVMHRSMRVGHIFYQTLDQMSSKKLQSVSTTCANNGSLTP